MKTVVWQPKALKQLKKLGDKPTQQRILAATATLQAFPAVNNIKALVDHTYGYRQRVGDYRMLFNVLDVIDIDEVKKSDEHTY